MSVANYKKSQVLLCTILFFVSGVSYAANSLCDATEKIIFNCQLKLSKKTISVCGSQSLTKDSGYIQYRFGTKKNLELIYPSTKINSQSHFFWNDKRFYQSSLFELTFENKGYFYTLSKYDVSDVMNDIPSGAQGGEIIVQKKGDARYNTLKCSGYPDGDFYLQGIVRDREELIDAKL